MTYDEYNAIDAVRATELKRLMESPAHYRHPPEDTDTPERQMLRGIHCLVLEGPEQFERQYARYPKRRYGREYTEWLSRNEGKVVLNPHEHNTAWATANHILKHPLAGPFFSGKGQSEVSLRWIHRPTGIESKARLDRLTRDSEGRWVLLDLKSYGTTDPAAVARMARKLKVPLQMAHYCEGLAEIHGITDARVLIVTAETRPPYDVGVFELGAEELEEAEDDRDQLMADLVLCRKFDDWPGRSMNIQHLFTTT